MAISENQQLSSSYTIADLTKTNQSLSEPNTPDSQWMIDNMVYLADMLEQLNSVVGPFNILSGFRTKELQQALAAAGEPATTRTSFHEAGRAVDIYPTNMSIIEYFGKILANPDLLPKFAEVSIKPVQNALHLAINVPGDNRSPKITALNTEKKYVGLSLEEIQNYAAPYMQAAQEIIADVSDAGQEIVFESVGSSPIIPMAIGGGALILGYLLIFNKKKRLA